MDGYALINNIDNLIKDWPEPQRYKLGTVYSYLMQAKPGETDNLLKAMQALKELFLQEQTFINETNR